MSSFSSLLNQFKVTTHQVTVLPADDNCPASEPKTKKRPHSITGSDHNYSGVDKSASRRHHYSPHQYCHRPPSTPVRTIYIACPAGAETGGPEALHQLCHMINVGEYKAKYSSQTDDVVVGAVDQLNETIKDSNDGEKDHDHPRGTIEFDAFGGRESRTQQSTNTDDTDHRSWGRDEDMPTKPTVIRAYMLYLRERTTKSGRVVVEHIPSERARSTKYQKYLAPPALQLPGSTNSLLAKQGQLLNPDSEVEEYSSDLVIWPECWTNLIDSLQPVEDESSSSIDDDNQHGKQQQQQQQQQQLGERSIANNNNNNRRLKYQIAIWWLSVNNNNGQFTLDQFASRRDVLHLVQSAYAREYVLSRLVQPQRQQHGTKEKKDAGENDHRDNSGFGSNLLSLTEFIPYSSPTFSSITSDDVKNRDIDVVYNPAKGMHYTDEIIRWMCGGGSGWKKARTKNWNDGGGDCGGNGGEGSIQFTPIGKGLGGRERMTGEEVVDLLSRSKVYIDFGPHPGMDRLPREAALAGCVVITNSEGAAKFHEDVPLPLEFKFRSFDVDKICHLLREICVNHAAYTKKMTPYREWVVGQETQMRQCVDQLVDRVVTRRVDKNAGGKTG